MNSIASLRALLEKDKGSDTQPSLDKILRLMAEYKASDCFVSVGSPIKLKLEGQQIALSERPCMKDDIELLLAEGLHSGHIDELDTTKELNCAISKPGVGRFRVSGFMQRNSKALVIRFIPPDVPNFDDLHLPEILKDIIMLKRGLVLVVGPTGSGKSTTLASLIDHRNATRADHILTLEDPIEFLYRHKLSVVNQREIGTDAQSYHAALRNALRQAPDVILIGEVRDRETMGMAMQYAQSGHLVLATMHANNSYHALNRIVSFYPPDNRDALFPDLSSSLKAIVAQRLVPGFDSARLPAVEILINSRRVQDLISKGQIDKIGETMEQTIDDGTQTFERVLVDLVAAKKISVETALIYADSATNIFHRLSQMGLSINAESAVTAGVDRSAVQGASQSSPSKKHANPSEAASFNGFTIDTSKI